MCGGPLTIRNVLGSISDFARKVDPLLKNTQDLPGTPGSLSLALSSRATSKPFGSEASVGDIFAGGGRLSRDEDARTIGRIIGSYFAAVGVANAAGAGAEGAAGGVEGGTGITPGTPGVTGITPGTPGVTGITPAAGTTLGTAAATSTAAAESTAPAAKTASTGISLKDAVQAVTAISALAPLLAKPPEAPAGPEAPTPPPAPSGLTGKKPTGPQRPRRNVGDPTALTGPGGIPFENLTLGRATILGG